MLVSWRVSVLLFLCFFFHPRHPVIVSDDEWDVQVPPKRILFRFRYHSQEVSQDP